jgi:NAD dependent epimerase/dehydratase family enzyme
VQPPDSDIVIENRPGRAVRWLIERENISGAINIAAPEALPNDAFMRELRRACGVRIGIPAPERLLDMAAFVLRHEPELLLKSRRVAPGCLLADCLRFNYPSWREAALDLCHGNGREW